jgi:hypothetical protein
VASSALKPILTLHVEPQAALAHEILENAPAGLSAQIEQAGGLVQPQGESGHLPVGTHDRRNQVWSLRLTVGQASEHLATLRRFEMYLHHSGSLKASTIF